MVTHCMGILVRRWRGTDGGRRTGNYQIILTTANLSPEIRGSLCKYASYLLFSIPFAWGPIPTDLRQSASRTAAFGVTPRKSLLHLELFSSGD